MYFLCKAHHCLLMIRNTSWHFNTTLKCHLRQWNHDKKHKSTLKKKWPYKVQRSVSCLKYEGWNTSQSIAFFSLNWDGMCTVTQIFCHSVYVCEWLWKHWEYWLWSYKCILANRLIHKYETMNSEFLFE